MGRSAEFLATASTTQNSEPAWPWPDPFGGNPLPQIPDQASSAEAVNFSDERLLGAHLVSSRIGYSHHGIYVGDQRVVHYSGLADGLNSGQVAVTSVEEFINGQDLHVQVHAQPRFSPLEIVSRATSRLLTRH